MEITLFGSCRLARETSVSYRTIHSRDRMTCENKNMLSRRSASPESSHLKTNLKVEFREFYLPLFLLLAIGPGWDYYCLLAPHGGPIDDTQKCEVVLPRNIVSILSSPEQSRVHATSRSFVYTRRILEYIHERFSCVYTRESVV